jgi:hypothetical protein
VRVTPFTPSVDVPAATSLHTTLAIEGVAERMRTFHDIAARKMTRDAARSGSSRSPLLEAAGRKALDGRLARFLLLSITE